MIIAKWVGRFEPAFREEADQLGAHPFFSHRGHDAEKSLGFLDCQRVSDGLDDLTCGKGSKSLLHRPDELLVSKDFGNVWDLRVKKARRGAPIADGMTGRPKNCMTVLSRPRRRSFGQRKVEHATKMMGVAASLHPDDTIPSASRSSFFCASSRVEERRGDASDALRFHSPLIKPDVQFSRIRLSDRLIARRTAATLYARGSARARQGSHRSPEKTV
jgi:hypothetical protein